MIIHWCHNDGDLSCSRAEIERNPDARRRYWYHLEGNPDEACVSAERASQEKEQMAKVTCPECRAYLDRQPTLGDLFKLITKGVADGNIGSLHILAGDKETVTTKAGDATDPSPEE